MRILYVQKDLATTLPARLRQYLKQQVAFADQDGFFEASLREAGSVTTTTFRQCRNQVAWVNSFDVVVVNMKCYPFKDATDRDHQLSTFIMQLQTRTAVFIGAAEARIMLPDWVIDQVDVVFKREPFRDRTRYDLSVTNQEKIVPTMISCPFVRLWRPTFWARCARFVYRPVPDCQAKTTQYDVGFSGVNAYSHTLRFDVWQRVIAEEFSTVGGLQPNPYKAEQLPAALIGPRYHGRAYRRALCAAKINLALPGIGEYTFRHQELLYLGACMMADTTIAERELPIPLEPEVHYIAFANLDDLVKKINYYLEHPAARARIAAAGQALFTEYYQPKRHAAQIRKVLTHCTVK